MSTPLTQSLPPQDLVYAGTRNGSIHRFDLRIPPPPKNSKNTSIFSAPRPRSSTVLHMQSIGDVYFLSSYINGEVRLLLHPLHSTLPSTLDCHVRHPLHTTSFSRTPISWPCQHLYTASGTRLDPCRCSTILITQAIGHCYRFIIHLPLRRRPGS